MQKFENGKITGNRVIIENFILSINEETNKLMNVICNHAYTQKVTWPAFFKR